MCAFFQLWSFSMASYGGELLLDSSSPWSGISSLSSFSISLSFIFQETKESIDEEDPRLTSSNGAYITRHQQSSPKLIQHQQSSPAPTSKAEVDLTPSFNLENGPTTTFNLKINLTLARSPKSTWKMYSTPELKPIICSTTSKSFYLIITTYWVPE